MKKKRVTNLLVYVMKITSTQLLLICLFAGFAYGRRLEAQTVLNKTITISAERVELKKVISLLQTQTGSKFIYSSHLIHADRKISCNQRGAEALVQMRRSRQDDPMPGIFYSDTGWLLYIMERDDEAIVEARRGVELDPENINNLLVLGLICLRKGMPDEAIQLHRKVMKLDPNTTWPLAYTLGITGRKAEARKLMDAMLRRQDADSAFGLGWAYIARGDRDEALRGLEIPRQRHAVWTGAVGVFPEFASLRGDPRFTAILAKIGVPDVEPGFGQPAAELAQRARARCWPGPSPCSQRRA